MQEPLPDPLNTRLPRHNELAALERILLLDQPITKTVVLHGAPGSGKTVLAEEFVRLHRRRFPGGAYFAGPHDLDSTDFASRVQRDQRSLLVIDEADSAAIEPLGEFARKRRQALPLMSLLLTCNTPLMLTTDTRLVEMPALTMAQVVALLTAGSKVSAERLAQLAALLAGNAEATELVSRRLAAGVPPERIIEWLESGRIVPARDPLGRPLVDGSPVRDRIELAVSEVGDDLIAELARRPELLYELHPRKFEELIAELYSRRGFDATLTPASGDEGADIYVVSRNDLGRTLWVVQAKRNAPHRKIKAGVVRELLGTVTAKNASAGILVTTSFFQPGAVDLEREFEYRLSLRDYLDIQEMLRGTGTDHSGG